MRAGGLACVCDVAQEEEGGGPARPHLERRAGTPVGRAYARGRIGVATAHGAGRAEPAGVGPPLEGVALVHLAKSAGLALCQQAATDARNKAQAPAALFVPRAARRPAEVRSGRHHR